MIRRVAPVVAAITAGAVVFALGAAPATATDLNDSFAAAARVIPGAGATPTVTTGGAVGALLSPVTSVLNQVVNPLATALSGLSATMVGDLAGLAGAEGTASSSDVATQPGAGYPTCNTPGWDIGNCYGPAGPAVNAAPVIAVTSGSMQGYASAGPGGSVASARAVNYQLAVLGVPVGNLGAGESRSSCDASLVCTSTATLTGTSLLNGAVGVQTASDGSLQVSLNQAAYVSASALSAPVPLTVPGLVSASVQAGSGLVKVRVGLTLHSLLTALGVPDTLTSLNSADQGSTVVLTIGIGATHTASSTTGIGHGLDVSIGLAVNATILVLGLATISLQFADSSAGNLAGLQLAFTSATDANPATPKRVKSELK